MLCCMRNHGQFHRRIEFSKVVQNIVDIVRCAKKISSKSMHNSISNFKVLKFFGNIKPVKTSSIVHIFLGVSTG